ncbi:PH domain-containing protein [Oceanobacillus halophilus]|uniref:YdbS-like PH domain-containing protein n=1 Tax=Oceanobacillus halophilus TaxID=930130 RepID=A0A494ZXX2_9BACI|nr:PH domain-containing protein [Oceanobacillus halophilus]RKQ30942.1 hypothetical protein D8M06_14960 [Oceanobacillus halophilus]
MSKAKRLHPAAIVFNFVQGLKGWIFYIIISFVALRDSSILYFILGLLALLLIIFTFSFLSWYRFTYRIVADELRMEYGILIRKKRYISKNRIQSIDLTQGVIHRIFNLTKVQIETASSGTDAEASLKAVKLAEGERIRDQFKGHVIDPEQEDQPEVDSDPVFSISSRRLWLAGATSGSAGIILAFVGVGFSEIEQFIPEHFYDSMTAWIIGLSLIFIITLGIFLLFFIWILGILGTMIKYWKFTITKKDDELFITRGLLEKKQITIPIKRIQAVGINESVIRQPFGFVTLFAEVAGSSLDKGEDFSTVLFPILRKTEVKQFLDAILPGYDVEMDQSKSILVPKRGLKYYLIRASLIFVLLGIGTIFLLPKIIWFLIPVLLVFLGLGYLRFKNAAYQIDENRLIIQYRNLSKTTVMVYHKRIQAFEEKQHKLHQKENLATIKVSVLGKMGAGKVYKVKELDKENADKLADWYSYSVSNK